MTKIICGWSACKYNTSKEVDVQGFCTKDEVSLIFDHRIYDKYEINCMQCENFKWDNDKFWR